MILDRRLENIAIIAEQPKSKTSKNVEDTKTQGVDEKKDGIRMALPLRGRRLKEIGFSRRKKRSC